MHRDAHTAPLDVSIGFVWPGGSDACATLWTLHGGNATSDGRHLDAKAGISTLFQSTDMGVRIPDFAQCERLSQHAESAGAANVVQIRIGREGEVRGGGHSQVQSCHAKAIELSEESDSMFVFKDIYLST